jgi:type IV secretion system protein VirB11
MPSPSSALETYLIPLAPFLQDHTVAEILINRPGQVLIEKDGDFFRHDVPALTWRHLMGLADLIARFSQQYLNETKPLLSGSLPSGHRVQIVLPPATLPNQMVIAIRKQTLTDVSLDDYEKRLAFRHTQPFYLSHARHAAVKTETYHLDDLFLQRRYSAFLQAAIRAKKNILISGATSTGKTTFLNACLKEISRGEHIITLEDVAEVHPPYPERHTTLLTSKGLQGTANVTMQDLVQASLRLKPDRIILGELRGAEAADFIHATATGHDGALSSIHAANPDMAFLRLTHMVQLTGTPLTREAILEDLHTVIDIVVQLQRQLRDGHLFREVTSIYYADAPTQASTK